MYKGWYRIDCAYTIVFAVPLLSLLMLFVCCFLLGCSQGVQKSILVFGLCLEFQQL